MKKLTTEEFIERARKVHGNKYGYSKVEYNGCNEKVCIVCQKHGEFWQKPKAHLFGNQCRECGIIISSTKRRASLEQFIERAREIHGDKYDYSESNYVNNKTKVCIICKEHGRFWQNPKAHAIIGCGCPKCGAINSANAKKLTKEEFVNRSKKVHGDKYNYSKVKYIDNKTKLCIICQEHGEFWQKPSDHMNRHGCAKCKGVNRKDTKQFIKMAIKVHGNKYDYSEVKYINDSSKVRIICKKHGAFLQSPNSHLRMAGCPRCRASHGEAIIERFLKKHNVLFEPQKKFKECKDKELLSFDFYLQDLNLLIEYDGRQHFEPIKCWGGIDKFNNLKRRDKIKNKYAKDNSIDLLRISFTDKDNINKILRRIA